MAPCDAVGVPCMSDIDTLIDTRECRAGPLTAAIQPLRGKPSPLAHHRPSKLTHRSGHQLLPEIHATLPAASLLFMLERLCGKHWTHTQDRRDTLNSPVVHARDYKPKHMQTSVCLFVSRSKFLDKEGHRDVSLGATQTSTRHENRARLRLEGKGLREREGKQQWRRRDKQLLRLAWIRPLNEIEHCAEVSRWVTIKIY